MLRFFAKKIAAIMLTLLLASVLVFVVLEILPGNAAQVMLGADADPEAVAALAQQLGLHQPAIWRYIHWIIGLLQGDMGNSYAYGSAIAPIIFERLSLTLPLSVLAMTMATIAGVVLGLLAAAYHKRGHDYVLVSASQLGMAIPNFWFALLLIIVFSVQLRWFAAGGFNGWGSTPCAWVAALKSLLLPALALAVVQTATITRITRAAVLEVLHEDYVRTARARGLKTSSVLFKHVLRNALNPILTLLGLQFAYLLAGAIVVENVFSLPGLGRLLFQAIANRDVVLVRNAVIFLVSFVIITNAAVDIVQTMIDPRLRPKNRQ